MNNTVEFVDSWGCKHTLTLEGAAEELKAFYDAWPGGLEEIESAIRTAKKAQGEQAPFGYFHELLNHEGKGNGVWLGSRSKSVTEQSYIEGEVSKEIVPLYTAPPSSAQTNGEDIRNQASPAAQSGAVDDLPALPEPPIIGSSRYGSIFRGYTADQMRDYARSAVELSRAQAGQQAKPVSRDWPEDFSHENGNYQCRCCKCGNVFNGHKRRVVCKACATPASEQPAFQERDPSKPPEQQGIFRKFDVRRVDGSDQPGGKHHGCRYFVLDMSHDSHAKAALRAYAAACKATHPQLADEIDAEFGEQPAAQPVIEAWKYRVLVNKHTTGEVTSDQIQMRGVWGKPSGWMVSMERPTNPFLLDVIGLSQSAAPSEQPAGWMKYFAAERLKNDGFDGYKLTVHGTEYSTYTNEFEYLLKAMLSAAPQPVAEQVGEKSVFLANLHYFFAQTDGSYKWPNGLVGDLLKQAKREIEDAHPQATQTKENAIEHK